MRKVVDSSCMQSPELRAFLSRSTNNYAVLTDYASMEAYKGDTLSAIFRSMEVLGDFPEQVIVLKTTSEVCGMSGRGSGLQKRLIDDEQTKGFGRYCEQLSQAREGDAHYERQLLEFGREADLQMTRMLKDAIGIPDALDDIGRYFSPDELRAFRSRGAVTAAIEQKFKRLVTHTALRLFQDHPRVIALPPPGEVSNTFIFRFALCAIVWAIRWLSVGGASTAKPERLRNDIVDLNYAVYATFFDGLMSNDRKLVTTFHEATRHLATIRADWARA